jgi:hypothetical protein
MANFLKKPKKYFKISYFKFLLRLGESFNLKGYNVLDER